MSTRGSAPQHPLPAAPGAATPTLPVGPASERPGSSGRHRRVLVPLIPAKDRPAAGLQPPALPASNPPALPPRRDGDGRAARAASVVKATLVAAAGDSVPHGRSPVPCRTSERTEPGRAAGRAPGRGISLRSRSSQGTGVPAASQAAPADGRLSPESPVPAKATAGEHRGWAGAGGSPGEAAPHRAALRRGPWKTGVGRGRCGPFPRGRQRGGGKRSLRHPLPAHPAPGGGKLKIF